MIRRHITPFRAIMGLAVALAAAAGLLVATGPAAHGAVAAPHTVARVVGPAFLRDGNGTGKAASAVPGHPPSPGNNVDTFGAGAWKTQWNGDGTICLSSAPHLCFADNSGLVKFRTHDATHADQIWILIGGSEIKNESSGNFLCATGGNDFVVITASLNNCSSYHSSWAFASTAAKSGISTMAFVGNHDGVSPTTVTKLRLRVSGDYWCEIGNTKCATAQPGSHPVDGSPVFIYTSGLWKWENIQCCVVHSDTFKYTPIYNALHDQPIFAVHLSATSNPDLDLNNAAGTGDLKAAGTGGNNMFWVYDSSTGWLVNIGRSNQKDNWEVLCGDGSTGTQVTITTRNACTHKAWEFVP